jgi:hypothetical protein
MKKKIFFVCLMIFSLGVSTTWAINSDPKKVSDNPAVTNKIENKLTDEEVSRLTKRVEQIRDMDKSNLTFSEKRDLRKELTGIKEDIRKDGGYIYLSVGTVIIIVILILLLA